MTSLLGTLNVGVTVTAGAAPPVTPAAPAAPTAPVAPTVPVVSGTTKASWAMSVGDSVYVNVREGSPGPLAWVPYTVAYVFGDGNAALVREPGFVEYTARFLVGVNLRRKGETYADPYPGP